MSRIMESARGASAFTSSSYPSSRGRVHNRTSIVEEQSSSAKEWDWVIDELLRLRTLEDDWDGEGSPAPNLQIVDGAIIFSQHSQSRDLTVPNRVHASVNGTVYFEWFSPHKYHEMEFTSSNEGEVRVISKLGLEAEQIAVGQIHW